MLERIVRTEEIVKVVLAICRDGAVYCSCCPFLTSAGVVFSSWVLGCGKLKLQETQNLPFHLQSFSFNEYLLGTYTTFSLVTYLCICYF